MEFTDEQEIIDGFIDAGCNEEQIAIVKNNISNKAKLTAILVRQRQKVLDNIHKNTNQMHCIDYLLFYFQKETRQTKAKE